MAPCSPPLTEPQLAALAKIACGIESGTGIALLCGPPGVGKTTVLEHLAADLGLHGQACIIRDVSGWLETDEELPEVVFADDAHNANEADLTRLLARGQARRPTAPLVLAGQGRLLTLISRDRRLEQATRLTAALLPGCLDVTGSLIGDQSDGPRFDETAILAIHEIAGGVPADILKLADLARLVAVPAGDGHVTADDIEAIHRRLSPRAA